MKLLTREDEIGAERFAEGERHMRQDVRTFFGPKVLPLNIFHCNRKSIALSKNMNNELDGVIINDKIKNKRESRR